MKPLRFQCITLVEIENLLHDGEKDEEEKGDRTPCKGSIIPQGCAEI